MKRFYYIANIRLPTEKAHGVQIMEMCAAFAKAGADVHLLVPRRATPIIENPFTYYGINKTFSIKYLWCVDAVGWPIGALGFWIQTITFLWMARRVLARESSDVLYTREPRVGLMFKNFVLEVHDLPKHISRWQRLVWRRAQKIVVLTKYLKEEIVAQGIPESKIIVAPDGVNLQAFNALNSHHQIRHQLGLPVEKKIAMYVGSFYLYDWKGVDVLLRAAEKLPENIVVVAVGGNEHEIATIQTTYPTAKNLLLIGRKKHAEVAAYLQVADVLVLPNTRGDANSERYTSPLKLFEYMASGTPIVASDLPSIREILSEKNAFLVPPGDVDALAVKIQSVVANKEEASRRATQALRDVQAYTWDRRAQAILAFMEKNHESGY